MNLGTRKKSFEKARRNTECEEKIKERITRRACRKAHPALPNGLASMLVSSTNFTARNGVRPEAMDVPKKAPNLEFQRDEEKPNII